MNKLSKKYRTLKVLIGEGEYVEILKRFFLKTFGYKSTKNDNFSYLVEEKELKPKYEKALLHLSNELNIKDNLGDYLEFGVCHGSSLSYMVETLRKLKIDNIRIFGFDSFEGLPKEALNQDDGVWVPGTFNASIEKVKSRLSKLKIDWNKVILVKGWFKDTLNKDLIEKYKIKKASIIMIDSDIYSAAKEALTFCAPLIKDKAIIFFDDWHSSDLASKNLGEKKAFDEFLNENPHIESMDFDSYSYFGKPNGEIKLVSVKN